MPRKSSTTLAVTVALGLTVGTAAAYSSQPRPDRVTSAHAAATSSASAGAGSGCARKYRNSTTKVGVNLSTVRASGREVSAQSATFRPPRVVRMWDNRSDPASAWKGMTRDLPRRTSMVLSIRHSPQEVIAGQWDNQIAAFFKQAPKHRLIFWNYFHEPEDEVQSHQFTTAQYRSAFRHVADIAARYCRHNLVPTLVLKGWTADPRSGKASRGAWCSFLREVSAITSPVPGQRSRRNKKDSSQDEAGNQSGPRVSRPAKFPYRSCSQ